MNINNINQETREKIYPIWNMFAKKFPVTATKIKYKIVTGHDLDLNNPETLNEKKQKLKLYN